MIENESVKNIIKYALDKKGENIFVANPGEESSVSDWFIIVEGTNTVHNKTIAEEIIRQMKKEHSIIPWHKEGLTEARWILIDYSDILVNIMLKEVREYYNLEELMKEFKHYTISEDFLNT